MNAPTKTGNAPTITRLTATETFARALGREMRSQRFTNEKLEHLTGIAERRIESLRSYAEDAPVYLEDFLTLASVLGKRFVTGVLADVDMYASDYSGESPEKIAGQIKLLAGKLMGEAE